jgi:hypothetical protein
MSSRHSIWITLSLTLLLTLSFLLSACNTSSTPATPTANSANTTVSAATTATAVPAGLLSEKVVRYILADSQLGSRIDEYRKAIDQPNIAEAVCRWDKGVRVQNIAKFERKVVGPQGWNVVYSGTDTIIDGMDVTLTSDVTCAVIATPGGPTEAVTATEEASVAATLTPQATATALIEADDPQCQNSYWPIVTGATWNFTVNEYVGKSVDEKVIITKVWEDNGKAFFSTSSSLNGNAQYQCIAGAIYDANNDLVLPSETNLTAGYQFTTSQGSARIQGGSTVKTSSGTFTAIGVCLNGYCQYYAQNVGMVSATTKSYTESLDNLIIPQ